MNWAHSRQTLPSRKPLAEQFTFILTKTTSCIFLPRFSIFVIPFGNTEVVILIYFRELLYERRIDGTSEQMSSSSRSDLRV